MEGSPGPEGPALEQTLCVSHEVLPHAGEDCCALQIKGSQGYLCVADGCGGLGSRRYGGLGQSTGAFLASRLAVQEMRWRLPGLFPLPTTQEQGRALCGALAAELLHRFQRFEAEHGGECRVRIVGKMQRPLPTTLCTVLMEYTALGLDCLFLWAGDSRGYILDPQGLHQLTADHTALRADPMESLYRDVPLSNMLSAQEPFFLGGRRVRVQEPCVALLATDGVYACLPTPMELEWLLLWTLGGAADMDNWEKRMHRQLVRMASDDCTLQLLVYGYRSFEELKAAMEERRRTLQKVYITPARRRKADLRFAYERWQEYSAGYDWTERMGRGEPDWRV